jgi:hypothetical protein
MEINDLIRLAAKADLEGNFRVADRITVKIENMSRTAINFGPIANDFLESLGAIKIKGSARNYKPTIEGNVVYKGYEMTPAQREQLNRIHLDEIKANRAPSTSNAGGGGGGNNGGAGGGGGASAVGVQGGINITAPAGPQGERGFRGYRGYKGLKGDPGPQGPAGKWWPGLVAGLLSGAIGAGGVAAWLTSRGADDVVIRDIENHLGRLPQFQMMTRRTDSGDLTGAKAIRAQNFVDTNATNPRLKNQRDWYNLALQQSGGDENFANNVISLVKATPQMPSSIGGGPNI